MIFMPDCVKAEEYTIDEHEALVGKVAEVFDYGMKCFAKVEIGNSNITILHRCLPGEKISIKFNEKGFNVKDKTNDIIIVWDWNLNYEMLKSKDIKSFAENLRKEKGKNGNIWHKRIYK